MATRLILYEISNLLYRIVYFTEGIFKNRNKNH